LNRLAGSPCRIVGAPCYNARMETLSFDAMVALVQERSDALRAAATEAGMTARVPGCPDWTAADLISHLGGVHRFWAASVAAGPSEDPPEGVDEEVHGDLLEWSADATAQLVQALQDAGPDRLCWTWWEEFGFTPNTSEAIARHQVQEAAVHAFDAQQAAGHGEPLPPAIAADGVNEYLTVELPTNGPWPYEPATVIVSAGRGGDWLIDLEPEGLHVLEGGQHGGVKPYATVTGDPSDIVLAFYRRDHGDLQVEGDEALVPQLINWPNLD
ncbi:MAG TPA: maleylpyruvate isomerase family mycothiol-dependent enzyme, partial [Streptosporangiaceae bacterium]|nr:maleylpyruvate isomerase family mycothiol-dependent enzyme [Streptosporangiaceae bacterium]